MKNNQYVRQAQYKKGFVSMLLISVVIVAVAIGGYFVWSKKTTPAKQQESNSITIPVKDERYTQVELGKVESYKQAAASDMVITSGTVVGVRLSPNQVLLSDGKDSYIFVSYARAFRDEFTPIFSALKIGDMVEVRGSPSTMRGVLTDSKDGKIIESSGVNLGTVSTFGAIALTGMKKLQVDTAQWKTYTNTQYGFELKYPSNLGSEATRDETVLKLADQENCKTLVTGDGKWPKGCMIYTLLIQKNKITDGLNKKTTPVLGYPAERLEINDGMYDHLNQTYIQFQKDGNWYISYISFHSENKSEGESLLNQIISSFKFTK